MKLSGINIDSYLHLENLEFDFTYPAGHLKASKPLDKICFIGQSAVGKTTLLDIVKQSVIDLQDQEIVGGDNFLYDNSRLYDSGFEGTLQYIKKEGLIEISKGLIKIGNSEYKDLRGEGYGVVSKLIEGGIKLLYLNADLISKQAVNILNQNPSTFANHDRNVARKGKSSSENYIYHFEEEEVSRAWHIFLSEIIDYRKRFTQLASELIYKGLIADRTKVNTEFDNWAIQNPNPLKGFSNFFNPILEKLGLEVDLVNTEFAIPIKSKSNQKVIPVEKLSTGTKGLLLSMFPLFHLDTDEAIILIDEPERSLFPDMQVDLIERYQKLAPNAQIIVATHSPFIAASFEPEERFILNFDEEGKVTVRKGVSPRGDDPNDILSQDFEVDYYNSFGAEAYKRYLTLKEKMSSEVDPIQKRQLLREVTTLGDEYNF